MLVGNTIWRGDLICCEKAASTAANKKCRQWDVRQVLPIDGIFAERCIYYLLTTNWGSAVPSLQLARVFFRDYRDHRDAEKLETTETTETQGQQRKMISNFVVVSLVFLVSLVSFVPLVSSSLLFNDNDTITQTIQLSRFTNLPKLFNAKFNYNKRG